MLAANKNIKMFRYQHFIDILIRNVLVYKVNAIFSWNNLFGPLYPHSSSYANHLLAD